MFVTGVYRAPPAGARPVRGNRVGGGFNLPEAHAEGMEAASGAATVSMPSLLAMQEAESGALQDRDAKRHGSAMIDELAELQRALLGDEGPRLERLAQLAGRPVAAADPRLAGVLRAIQLRAGIELARHQAAASQ
jgi:class II flagellar assembly regulator FliX